MKNKAKDFLLAIVTLLVAAMIGYFALVIAYYLPQSIIKDHVASGAETLLVEGAEFEYAPGYRAAILDNETDGLMLSNVVNEVTDPWVDALLVNRFKYDKNDDSSSNLLGYLHNDTDSGKTVSYARYWHGYLVFFKLFFLLFDYSDFRMINLSIVLALIIYLLYLLGKRNLTELWIPVTATFIIWNPASIGLSMQYSSCFYVSMLATIIYLQKNTWFNSNKTRLKMLFLLSGILIVYIDFLTYPIVTLCLPLMICVYDNCKNNTTQLGTLDIMRFSAYWALGYAGMWLEKWILASILTDENVIADAMEQLIYRSATADEGFTFSRIHVAAYLTSTMFKWSYVLLVFAIILFACFKNHNSGKSEKFDIRNELRLIWRIALIGLYPYLWYMLAANRSIVHPRLVYRALGITFASFAIIVLKLSEIIKSRYLKKNE